MLWRWGKIPLPNVFDFGKIACVSGGFLMGLSKNTEKRSCFLYE
jgi:hypothetical protein